MPSHIEVQEATLARCEAERANAVAALNEAQRKFDAALSAQAAAQRGSADVHAILHAGDAAEAARIELAKANALATASEQASAAAASTLETSRRALQVLSLERVANLSAYRARVQDDEAMLARAIAGDDLTRVRDLTAATDAHRAAFDSAASQLRELGIPSAPLDDFQRSLNVAGWRAEPTKFIAWLGLLGVHTAPGHAGADVDEEIALALGYRQSNPAAMAVRDLRFTRAATCGSRAVADLEEVNRRRVQRTAPPAGIAFPEPPSSPSSPPVSGFLAQARGWARGFIGGAT